jgi:hypothetical protein
VARATVTGAGDDHLAAVGGGDGLVGVHADEVGHAHQRLHRAAARPHRVRIVTPAIM